jgi:hypothetical protein
MMNQPYPLPSFRPLPERRRQMMRRQLEAVVAESPQQRSHRRALVDGALALVVVAVIAVTALLSASHQPSAQLAAWTVAKQSDGTILVTIRELFDPAGLQRKLRADGVRASVTFPGHHPSSRGAPPCGYTRGLGHGRVGGKRP